MRKLLNATVITAVLAGALAATAGVASADPVGLAACPYGYKGAGVTTPGGDYYVCTNLIR